MLDKYCIDCKWCREPNVSDGEYAHICSREAINLVSGERCPLNYTYCHSQRYSSNMNDYGLEARCFEEE